MFVLSVVYETEDWITHSQVQVELIMDVMSYQMEVILKKMIMMFLISFAISGCTSLNEVKLDPIPAESYVGEKVKITTISDEIFEFKVENVTELTLSGEGKSIDINSIKKIEVKEFSAVKSISLSTGLYMLGAVIIAVIAL
ncbi:hypothetical protein ACE02B_00150 [Shewanella mangrovisoli]|uniref:hypothetical protein n=2 Tax=Shewanella TaxID=22 RepID=UPI0035BA5F17